MSTQLDDRGFVSMSESDRLRALRRYAVMDTPSEPAFERIVELCLRIFRVPAAFVALIDEDRQWFKAVRGLPNQEMPRAASFCQHTILSTDILVVPDARRDDRFRLNSLVTDSPHIRFYASAPIRTPDGFNLGALSLIDFETRTFGNDEAASLRDLAALVADELELRLAFLRLSEAKKSEREAEAQVRAILDSPLFGVYVVREGRLSFINERFATILGRSREDLLGRRPETLGLPLPGDESFHPESPPSESRVTTRRGDDTVLILAVHQFSSRVEDSTVVMGTVFDVTGEAIASDALQRSERRLRALTETANDSIIVIDAESIVIFANRATHRIFGYEPEELLGHSLTKIMSDEDSELHRAGVRRAAVRKGEFGSHIGEFTSVHRNGEKLPVEISFGRFSEGEEVRFVGILRDIRERKLLEQQVARSRQISNLGWIAATLAHEFNNVLMGIQPAVETLVRSTDEAGRSRAATNALRSIERGASITRDALRLANPASLKFQQVDLCWWLRDMQDELRAALPAGIELKLDALDQPCRIRGDRHHLGETLFNLVRNARDAMPSGGTITLTLRQKEISGHQFIDLIVSDTGSGIDAEVLPRIFEPLFSTKGSGGTGIGLTLVQQIVNAHGGRIEVESGGGGTSFCLTFPRDDTDAPVHTPPPDNDQSLPGKVLIVDDDELVGTGLQALTETSGIGSLWVPNATTAKQTVGEYRPDLIVVDVMLRNESGIELARDILEKFPTIPIVFSTGLPPKDPLYEELLGRPNVGCLVKPYSIDQLVQEFRRIARSIRDSGSNPARNADLR
jgi:PAS domain S-box-containing protein